MTIICLRHSLTPCSLFLYRVSIFYPALIFIRTDTLNGMLTNGGILKKRSVDLCIIYIYFFGKRISKVLAKVKQTVLLFRVNFVNNVVYILF